MEGYFLKNNSKINLRYKQLLITNLVLMTIPSIFFVIAIITKLFNGDESRITVTKSGSNAKGILIKAKIKEQ